MSLRYPLVPPPIQVILSIDDHGEVMWNTVQCSLKVMTAFQVRGLPSSGGFWI